MRCPQRPTAIEKGRNLLKSIQLFIDVFFLEKVKVVRNVRANWDLPRDQTMTEAEHNRLIPKLFDNRPSALAAEVFCETIGLVKYIQYIPIIVSFSLLLS